MSQGAAPIPLPIRTPARGASQLSSRYARFGDFELDLQRQELYRSGVRIKLQTKVHEALLVLLEASHELVSREVIRQRLWPGDSLVNFDANVNTTVNKLRQVLEDSAEAPKYVETIPRRGYSFVSDVEFADSLLRASDPAEPSPSDESNRRAIFPGIHSPRWLAAVVFALVLSGMLFGAAITLYTQRAH